MKKIKFECIITVILLISVVFLSGCITDNYDEPQLPERGFFMGILPSLADDQDFDEVYNQASVYSEFVPIWSSGTGADGFWDYNEKLKGNWGKQFIKGLFHVKTHKKRLYLGKLVLLHHKYPDTMIQNVESHFHYYLQLHMLRTNDLPHYQLINIMD